MRKRLIWNFELDTENPLDIARLGELAKDEITWEVRYFWPETAIIPLKHVPDHLLDMKAAQFKHRSDVYTLLPKQPFNIKMRENRLLYKPLMRVEGNIMGFAKKINLDEVDDHALLPGIPSCTKAEMLTAIKQSSRQVEILKTAVIYKLETDPVSKLELTRLYLPNGEVFYSAALEVNNLELAQYLSKPLLKGQLSCDYVSFLQGIDYSSC